MKVHIILEDEAATTTCGRRLGAVLQGGDCVGLVGTLGSGKTTLCRGIGEGLECVPALRSPTYLLCHEAQGRHPVLHLDAYFEARMQGLLEDGIAARFDREHVLLVEWADQLRSWWPKDRLELHLAGTAKGGRELTMEATGPRSQEALSAFKKEACGS